MPKTYLNTVVCNIHHLIHLTYLTMTKQRMSRGSSRLVSHQTMLGR